MEAINTYLPTGPVADTPANAQAQAQADQLAIRDLTDLEIALVGGGTGSVFFE